MRVWIIGRGGLLGSALTHASKKHGCREWTPAAPLPWNDRDRLREQFLLCANEFLGVAGNEPWSILWAAGLGVVGADQRVLDTDTAVLQDFLEALSTANKSCLAPWGTVLFSGSAGAVYGPSASVLDEESAPKPISAYGKAKLRQEELVADWAKREGCRALLMRFSNIYGTRQRPGKGQGFISRLSRCLIHRRPMHLYVPLATVRDYLHVDDAAECALNALQQMQNEAPGSAVVKIAASGRSTTLAEVVGLFTAVAKRRPPLVFVPPPKVAEHLPVVNFRSKIWPETNPPPRTLPEGIRQIHEHHLMLHRKGLLSSVD